MTQERLDEKTFEQVAADALVSETRVPVKVVIAEARRAREEAAELREALTDTANGKDKVDGEWCWCPSPTYAKAHGGEHGVLCRKCRAALAKWETP